MQNSATDIRPIDERIVKFIRRHHLLTLATVSSEGLPYCSSAFYAYDAERNALIFTAGEQTRHASELSREPRVAASIATETRIAGRIQGVQICGTVSDGDERDRKTYLSRFPYAAAIGDFAPRRLEPSFIKFTDNTLGFGKKLIWKRD